MLTDMGIGMHLISGLLAAAVMVAAASAAGRRTGVLPRGVVVAGLVVAPLLLVGFTWIPQFLVPLWVVAVSISLLRRPAPVHTDAEGLPLAWPDLHRARHASRAVSLVGRQPSTERRAVRTRRKSLPPDPVG